MSNTILSNLIEHHWEDDTLDALIDFVRLPAKSPAFDADWESHGFLKTACQKAALWGQKRFPQATFEVLEAPGKTPCLFFDIPAQGEASEAAAFFYGHLDKQPEAAGWTKNRAPFKPVIEEGRLYGRGCADDGYSIYAALTAVKALEEAKMPHPRCCGLIETREESGSEDLPHWLATVAPRCGKVGLVTVLDSAAGDYERLWITASFRGIVAATLRVKVLRHGLHSGTASGIAPESFMIARELLSRVENCATGEITDPAFNCPIPAERRNQIDAAAKLLADKVTDDFPWAGNTQPRFATISENLLAQTWKPQLAIIGAEGIPSLQEAGNVLRPETALRLSIRIPPCVDPEKALASLKAKLTENIPYGAEASIENTQAASGWNAPLEAPWFTKAVEEIGHSVFGTPSAYIAEGGSIPILNLFADTFPGSQMFVTGVLGPASNAHGPDEMLDIGYTVKLTTAVANLLHAMP